MINNMENLTKCILFSTILCFICISLLILSMTFSERKIISDLAISLIGSLVVSLFFAFVFLDLNPLTKIFSG